MFNPDKGFEFIKSDDGGNDVFVHVTTAERSGIELRQGMRLMSSPISTAAMTCG